LLDAELTLAGGFPERGFVVTNGRQKVLFAHV
jgi:hypothetical protein